MKHGVMSGSRSKRSGAAWLAQSIAVIAVVVAATLAVAAADSGTISGIVRDAGRAAIAGAKVIAEDPAANVRRETTTDSKGSYTFSNLPQGNYQITVQIAGFQPARYSKVELKSGKTLQYDFKLNAGATTEIVELGSTPLPKEKELDITELLSGRWATDAVATATTQKSKGGITESMLKSGIHAGSSNVATGNSRGGFGGGGGGFGGTAGGTQGGVVGGVIGGSLGGINGVGLGDVSGGLRRGAIVPPVNGVATVVPDLARTVNSSVAATGDNPFTPVGQTQLSTFSIDVDTASYSNVRRFLTQNQRPPRDIVRIEELVNYFSYDYPVGSGADPITGNIEVASAPWNPEHRLVRVGVRAKPVARSEKAANLVFLIDVSGSMAPAERLPLLKSSLRMLVDRLTENDRVSIVTYAGAAGVALQPTSGEKKETILRAIEGLGAGGSTNGAAGIQTAYDMAVANFITGGVNRVVLATDGDFNVGTTSQAELLRLIEGKAKSGVFLTVLGVGRDFKDNLLEKLADKGNGNYAYLDTLNEARRVLLEQMDATLVTVAKDVKIQVEFNPERVSAYRLIGYENRILAAADFNNDAKDAGDMGSGHMVTAFYEVIPRSAADSDRPNDREPRFEGPGVDPLRYRQVNAPGTPISDEMMNLRIRYKEPEGSASKLVDVPLVDRGATFNKASSDFRFAAAVAAFGMILRDSPYKGAADLRMVQRIASDSKGADRSGYREEFIRLTERASETWQATGLSLR